MREIREVVDDIDCKDDKFLRDEAAGGARMLASVVTLRPRDEDRLERGARMFDELHSSCGKATHE